MSREGGSWFSPPPPFASSISPATDKLDRPHSLIPFSYSLNLSSLSGRGSGGRRGGAPTSNQSPHYSWQNGANNLLIPLFAGLGQNWKDGIDWLWGEGGAARCFRQPRGFSTAPLYCRSPTESLRGETDRKRERDRKWRRERAEKKEKDQIMGKRTRKQQNEAKKTLQLRER